MCAVMDFSGRLTSFPVPDLLQWATNERRTGALVLRRSRREKWVSFHEGRIVGALSDDPAEFYGRYLLLYDLIDQPALLKVLGYSKENQVRLGKALCDLEILSEQQVMETLKGHIQDTVCDLFLWKHGIFYFRDEPPASSALAPSDIDTLGVLMEGGRWADEFERFREVLVHDHLLLIEGPSWPGEDLRPVQKKIVDLVDGESLLADVRDSLRGPMFRIYEATYGLVRDGVIRVEEIEGAPKGASTEELDLYDVLFEQAAEDRVLKSAKTLSLTGGLVETFYPVWVGKPVAEATGERTDTEVAFLVSLNGRLPLLDLLAQESDLRQEQYELLMREIKSHNVALLPGPAEDLIEEPADEPSAPESLLKRWWRRLSERKGDQAGEA